MKEIVHNYFPKLTETELRDKIASLSTLEKIPEDTVILRRGQYVKYLPLVISGSIKVIREEEGREILIYYIEKGESCAMSLTAYLNESKSEVKAVTTSETTALLLPTQHINEWMKQYSSWQNFALALYQKRFESLLQTVEDIAFKKMDQRLESYLQNHFSRGQRELLLTHSHIAHDLGTSREVVSRLLKQLEQEGRISLARNRIKNISLM